MTQVIQASCPYCHNTLRIPAEWLSQPLRCKFCKQVIQARSAQRAKGEPTSAALGRMQAAPAAPLPTAAVTPVQGTAAAPAHAASVAAVAPAVALPVGAAPPLPPPGYTAAPLATAPVPPRGSDPFSFDDTSEPAPLPTTVAVRRRQRSKKGLIAAAALFVILTTAVVLFVVFFGDELRDLWQGKQSSRTAESSEKVRPVEATERPAKSKPTENDSETSPPSDKGGVPEKKPSSKEPPSKKLATPIGEPKVKKPAEREQFPRRALLISINNYWLLNPVHYGSPPSQGYPGSSGATLANRLSNAPMYFPATQVIELSDSAKPPLIPQKAVIEEAIEAFCNTSRAQDRIMIFFAGHAIEIDKEAYLIPYEGVRTDPKTLIPLSWVYDQLAKCKARQKIFVLDAFRNPPARGFELPGTGAMSEDFDLKLQNPPPGVQVWSSCVKDQQSIEF
ncbi:MAG: caspase family protein, partial [Gemmataceae bacterium]|nr:caspase family protein [Gemmataceae bacterium]